MGRALDFANGGLGDAESLLGANLPLGSAGWRSPAIVPLRPHMARRQLIASPLTCERISVFLSFVCLLVSLIWRYGTQSGEDSLSLPIGVSRETLLFSRNANVTEGMQLLHSTWNNNCGKQSKMLLQRPTWENQETGVVMHGSVYALKIYIFPLACLVFSISILFQGWRCWKYDKTYKPEKGPDFSRWLEYFFTSPLQIIIVSISFGFATLDSLLGQCGMQAALVLLGYDIEQQVKKIYKRRKLIAENFYKKKSAKEGTARFHHVLQWAGIADLRIFVYLGFSWLLHIGIWGIPGVPGHGIGGKYAQLQQQLKECAGNGVIPDAVTAIYALQLVLFTVFGLVCTLQVFRALVGKGAVNTEQEWLRVSWRYSFLSLTAKTLLEIGLASFVIMYKPWIEMSEATTQKLHVPNTNTTCWAIQPGGVRP
jgi:hypothetical protein